MLDSLFFFIKSIDFWSVLNSYSLDSYEYVNSYVEIFSYYNESSPSKFVHYKVNGGQHEWFWNNWGFNASEELVNFFLQYELTDFINSGLLGDLNEDGYVNIQDIIITVSLALNNEYDPLADFNSDEFIDILDIVQLINIILNQ